MYGRLIQKWVWNGYSEWAAHVKIKNICNDREKSKSSYWPKGIP